MSRCGKIEGKPKQVSGIMDGGWTSGSLAFPPNGLDLSGTHGRFLGDAE